MYSASFVVDADGFYKEGSLQIAPFIWVIYQMMVQPDVKFKDIKLDGWDEVVKDIEKGFNLSEEKVSLDKAAREINAYLQENILKPMGVDLFRAGDVYGYCGFTAEEIQLVKAETMSINDLKSSFFLDDLQLVLHHIDTLKDNDKVLSYINSLNQEIEHYDLLKIQIKCVSGIVRRFYHMVDGLQSLIYPLCSKLLLILLRRTLKISFLLMDLLVQAKLHY